MVNDITNGILNAVYDFFGSIGSFVLDFFLTLIAHVINIIIFPINQLLISFMPNLSELIVHFNAGLSRISSLPIGFIMYHLPPITRMCILTYLGIMLGYYSILWTYRAIIIIPYVIRKIKFW